MRRNDGTFEEDIQCIIEPQAGKGGIFISNIQAASNHSTLLKHKIGAVVTAAKGKNMSQTMPKHIEYLYIPAIDHESYDLSKYFEASNQLLASQTKKTNVLVHCMAGVSRSVTLVIAYLMKSRNISFTEAYKLVKCKRKIISPNRSFLKQLQQYQTSMDRQTKKSFEQSTTTSWYSKSPLKTRIDEFQYDKNLKAKIHKLLEQSRVKVK